MDHNTTITVTYTTWKRLNSLKNFGDTFETVVSRLIDEQEKQKKG